MTPQEESFRMTSVRKAYQKAILAPVHLVEQIWKEYESFENSVSRALVGCLPFNQSQSLGVKQPPIVMHLWGSIKLNFQMAILCLGCTCFNMGYTMACQGGGMSMSCQPERQIFL